MISEEPVYKLSLFNESLPTHHRLAWLNSKTDTKRMKPSPAPETTKPVLVVSKAQFLIECQSADVLFAFVLKSGSTPLNMVVPPAFKDLVHEFGDVFHEELPEGLPLLRDIHHCIDLIPNNVLQNSPHYRISPKEHDELRRKV